MTRRRPRRYTPIIGYRQTSPIGTQDADLRAAAYRSSGLRLVDARASYGVGLETFALGFPVHFDWSWKTLFNKDWEDVLFASLRRQRRSSGSRSSRSGLATTSRDRLR